MVHQFELSRFMDWKFRNVWKLKLGMGMVRFWFEPIPKSRNHALTITVHIEPKRRRNSNGTVAEPRMRAYDKIYLATTHCWN